MTALSASAEVAASGRAPSPPARRVPTPRWFDLRLMLGVVLVLGSVLVGARVVSNASATYAVVAVSRDLAAGTVLTADDVRLASVQLPDHGRGVYVRKLDEAVGATLSHDVRAGELLGSGAIATTSAHTTITVALASGAAPELRAGQRVIIWLTTPTCPSVVLLDDIAVQSVRHGGSGAFDSGDGGQDVVIDVASGVAQRVNAALSSDNASLRAGVLSGRAGASAQLPDLTSCLGKQAR